MLVKDAVNEQTINASIESTKQHNINFLPVVILSHIRMNQQTHAVNASKEKLQRTMNNIRSHPDYNNKLAELEEFLILLRIVTTAYLHRLTLTMMIRCAWIGWNYMREQFDWMFDEDEQRIRRQTRNDSNNIQRDTILNDGAIVSCSQGSYDGNVHMWYRKTCQQLGTADMFMKLTRGRTVPGLYDLIEDVFDSGINGVKAEAHIQLMFMFATMQSIEDWEGLYHFNHKKKNLVVNETGSFDSVPLDTHVKRVCGYFAIDGLSKDMCATTFSHDIEELAGANANNLIGQLSQFLGPFGTSEQEEFAILILTRVAEIAPKFQEVVEKWLG